MDSFLLKLCWKNIWRNKRRTFLAVNAIAIGVTWLVWAHNYLDALNEQFVQNAIRYQNGHITVSAEGFQEYRVAQKFLRDPSALEDWMADNAKIRATSPTVMTQGLLSSPRGASNIWFVGVDPERERGTTFVHGRVKEGTYFESSGQGKPIVIGSGLRERLKIDVGSKLVALTQGVDGSIGNELFYVAGVFETQSLLDKTVAYTLIDDARSLLSLPEGAVHQYSVVLHRATDVEAAQAEMQGAFAGKNLEILSWMQVQKHLMASIEVYNAANKIFMFIILLIASVGIANSILMSIMERTREFGVMMAIGTSRADMFRMVLTETVLLASVGVFCGNLLGVAVTLYFKKFGFDLAWLTKKEITMNGAIIQTVSYPDVHLAHNFWITLAVLTLAILAAAFPIQYISKLRATAALKSN